MASHEVDEQLALENKTLQGELVRSGYIVAKLQLEFDIARQANQALEDRLAQFSRQVQEQLLSKSNSDDNDAQSPMRPLPSSDSATKYTSQGNSHQQQIEKYERMLRIMNNQILLVRRSSDDSIKGLKSQILNLMDEKKRTDRAHLDKVRDLDKTKRGLETSLLALREQVASIDSNKNDVASKIRPNSIRRNGNPSQPPQPPRRHKSIEDDQHVGTGTISLLKEDLKRLRAENQQLKQIHIKGSATPNVDSVEQLNTTIQQLTQHNRRLEAELNRSPPQPPRRLKSIGDPDIAEGTNVQCLTEDPYNKATVVHHGKIDDSASTDSFESVKESVQRLTAQNERLNAELTNVKIYARNTLAQLTDEKARLEHDLDVISRSRANEGKLSVSAQTRSQERRDAITELLDRAALLWDRATESILSMKGTKSQMQASLSHSETGTVETTDTASLLFGQIKLSLMLVELELRNTLAGLEFESVEDEQIQNAGVNLYDLKEAVNSVRSELLESINRVEKIASEQFEIIQCKSKEEFRKLTLSEDNEGTSQDSKQVTGVDMLISHEALEILQNEVLQVVESVKDKNETIDRLAAQVEEHKVRERSLMEELKRHMQDQADRQVIEHQRIMEQHASVQEQDDSGEYCDDGSSEYEEKTVHDGYFCEEITVYDEETVI